MVIQIRRWNRVDLLSFFIFPLLRKQIMNMDHEHTFCGMWMERAVCEKVFRRSCCYFFKGFYTDAFISWERGHHQVSWGLLYASFQCCCCSVYTGFHSWLMKSIKPQIVCSVMGDKWVPHLHDTFNGNIPGSVFNANCHSHVFVQCKLWHYTPFTLRIWISIYYYWKINKAIMLFALHFVIDHSSIRFNFK